MIEKKYFNKWNIILSNNFQSRRNRTVAMIAIWKWNIFFSVRIFGVAGIARYKIEISCDCCDCAIAATLNIIRYIKKFTSYWYWPIYIVFWDSCSLTKQFLAKYAVQCSMLSPFARPKKIQFCLVGHESNFKSKTLKIIDMGIRYWLE